MSCSGDSVAEVLTVAQTVEFALAARVESRCADVRGAGEACERAFQKHASEIRSQAMARLRVGSPPSLREVVGVSNLEVPMNRALGWLLSEQARGDSARIGLLALAELLEFSELAEDIEAGRSLVLHTETSPDPELSNRQPDFLIESPNAVALIENKVLSPESGPGQYSDYLELLLARAGARPARAYLLARDGTRQKPAGWERVVSHRELAEALRPLAVNAEVPLWDRVVYGLVATDLDSEFSRDDPRQIERLLHGEHALSEVAVAARLSQLLRNPTLDITNGDGDVV